MSLMVISATSPPRFNAPALSSNIAYVSHDPSMVWLISKLVTAPTGLEAAVPCSRPGACTFMPFELVLVADL